MPADYSSTARALALPVSPIASPSPEQTQRPPWSRHRSMSSRSRRSPYAPDDLSYTDQAVRAAKKVQRKVLATYTKMSVFQRIVAGCALLIINVLGILFLLYNERIFAALAPLAAKWRHVPGGWMILWACTFISAFPPLIGYSTTVTIAGFVYGFPNGWFIIASSTICGSLASFIASRTILSGYVHRRVGEDKRFEALALTLKHDGLKILCMIRLCPLPYSLSNAAMATFPTVQPSMFALATAAASPKLMIHIFIGSRLATLAENGGKMDLGTKLINYTSIIGGAILGASVGWIIYHRTIARAKELEIQERESLQNATIDSSDDGARRYSDDQVRPDAGMEDDDISLWDNEEDIYRDDFTDDEHPSKASDEEANVGIKGETH
jgi:uncharacterized membrane protein YdjX (TVP38/TMEM64 family)